jgi:hypothetical protein
VYSNSQFDGGGVQPAAGFAKMVLTSAIGVTVLAAGAVAYAQSDSPTVQAPTVAPQVQQPPVPSGEPILPVNQERLRLAHDLVAGLAPESNIEALGNLFLSEQLPKFQEKLKALPQRQQTLASDAFSNAFRVAQARHAHAAIESMTAYYAAHLSEDDLRTLVSWNDDPITKLMRTDPKSVTQEQRQEAGLYVIAHPAIMKLSTVVVGYMNTAKAEAGQTQATFQADFQQQLCGNLATTGVRLSTCPASAPATFRGAGKRGPVPAGAVRWVSTPQGSALSQFYPERALRLNMSGSAKAVCVVGDGGRLSNCAIVSESPTGFAFGDSLLKLSRFYQAASETPAGLRVVISMNFALAK